MTAKPKNYVIYMRQEEEDGDVAEVLVKEMDAVKSRASWKNNVVSFRW
jgi:hypothetical protein